MTGLTLVGGGGLYKTITVEDFIEELENTNTKIDLSNLLVISSGTLMYVSGKNQRRFFQALSQRGCKNFIFQEYSEKTQKHGEQHFKIDKELFIVKEYRSYLGPEQPATFVRLDLSAFAKQLLASENTRPRFAGILSLYYTIRRFVHHLFWQMAGVAVRFRRGFIGR